MNDLFMQIKIKENKRNRIACFDNIIKIRKDNQHFYVEDVDGWHSRFLMSEDVSITIDFTEKIGSD